MLARALLDSPTLIALVAFALVATLSIVVYLSFFSPHVQIESRLRDIAVKIKGTDGPSSDANDATVGQTRVLLQSIVQKFPEPKLDTTRREKLLLKLAQAGFNGPGVAKIFEVSRLTSMCLGGLGGFAIGAIASRPQSDQVLFATIGVLAGGFAPTYYIRRRTRSRQTRFKRELADVLDLLVVCVEAGQGLYEAIKTVGGITARQGQLLGLELNLLAGKFTAGASLAEGLHTLTERTGVEDIRAVAGVLLQSERMGTRMAPALRAASDALRVRRRLRAEEAAQKATIKMLMPLALFVLPAMLLVVIGPALVEILTSLH
jgi:tight adherence protein C